MIEYRYFAIYKYLKKILVVIFLKFMESLCTMNIVDIHILFYYIITIVTIYFILNLFYFILNNFTLNLVYILTLLILLNCYHY